MNKKNYIHIYSGPGKGKTTAAIGLAIRAAGSGKRIYIAQFLKYKASSEFKVLKNLENINFDQFGLKRKPGSPYNDIDKNTAEKAFDLFLTRFEKEKYDLVVCDELIVAVSQNLIPLHKVLDFLNKYNPKFEIVLTGRGASPELIEAADLVSIIEEKKHYFNTGISARKGIEF